MLEIKPCVDKPTLLPYLKAAGQIYSEAFYLYRAVNHGEVLAAALFRVGSEQVDLLYYETTDPDDAFLLDAVLRAGLNYADRFGIATGHIPDSFREEHAPLFRLLNFPPEPLFNINNFFQKYKNCRPGQ